MTSAKARLLLEMVFSFRHSGSKHLVENIYFGVCRRLAAFEQAVQKAAGGRASRWLPSK